jgi:hypothetical protein
VNDSSPAQGRATADGLNVEVKSTETGGQDAGALTPKQRTRYSSVNMEGKLAVRGPGYEAFDLATTIGKMMAPGGTFRTLLPGETGIAVVVRASHRDKVLEFTGITDRAWRSYVRKWEADRMAHRCAGSGRGVVTLLFQPQAVCPVPQCGAALPPERKEGSASERKQRSVEAEAAFRMNGSSVPRIVLNTGDASRDEEGDARPLPLKVEVAAVQERSEALERGFSEIGTRIRRERELGLADRDIAALLNQTATFPPPDGFVHWTGYAVRVAAGEASHAA